MNTEILNKYIELIDKGYCDDCNELNCLGNFPHKDIAKNIKAILEENQELKKQQKEFIEWLESEKSRLAKECSNTYEDSLGKLLYVNEDIFNEVNKILSKYKEIIGGDNNE